MWQPVHTNWFMYIPQLLFDISPVLVDVQTGLLVFHPMELHMFAAWAVFFRVLITLTALCVLAQLFVLLLDIRFCAKDRKGEHKPRYR